MLRAQWILLLLFLILDPVFTPVPQYLDPTTHLNSVQICFIERYIDEKMAQQNPFSILSMSLYYHQTQGQVPSSALITQLYSTKFQSHPDTLYDRANISPVPLPHCLSQIVNLDPQPAVYFLQRRGSFHIK